VKNKMTSLLFFVSLIFVSGCMQPTIKNEGQTQNVKKPLWLKNQDSLDNFSAVGFSRPNFQGMHIQHAEALNKARELLSQKISSYITLVYKNEDKTSKKSVSKNYHSSITNTSKLLLQNTHQEDAYIDEYDNLYVLVVVDKLSHSNFNLPLQLVEDFSITPLLERRCYSRETLLQIQTKSSMYKGKPIWFYRPDVNTQSIGSIGIAERIQTSTFISQKKVAVSLAKLALMQRLQLKMNSSDKFSTTVIHDELSQIEKWKTNITTSSKINKIKILDLWMDPKQCELYIWISK